jgi:uncharacterized MnhB-related membrane protein
LNAWLLALVVGAVVCAFQAIRAARLLVSAIWLAGVSALAAIALYLMDAREAAVIELSVGAGLVTVLFVFAISIAGEEIVVALALVPRWLAWVLVVVAVLLLAAMALAAFGVAIPTIAAEGTFADMLWQARGFDVLAQIVLIFGGVVGVLGLLADSPAERDEEEDA